MTLEQPEMVTEDAGIPQEMEYDSLSQPSIHAPEDPPLCAACRQLKLTLFDPSCAGCMDMLYRPTTTVPEIFAVLRQWTPQTQQILELLIRECLKKGAHVNDRDALTDMTLLHFASKAAASNMGDVDEACRMVNFLVSKGADVYIRSRWTSMTPMHLATFFNIAPVLEILLNTTQALDINSRCAEFEQGTPLHIAATNLCHEAAEVLLKNGANPTSKDDLNRTPEECLPDDSVCEGKQGLLDTKSALRTLLQDAKPAPPTSQSPNYDDVSGKVTIQAMGLQIGDKVLVGGVKEGTLRYCGSTAFSPGVWAGIELDEPVGKNDGSIDGICYFTCPPMHGVFAPIRKVSKPGAVSPARNRSLSDLRGSTDQGKIDTSGVTAKVDTGLSRSPHKTFPSAEPGKLLIGDHVIVAGQRRGVIRFSGETRFAPGWWYGIELERMVGKNDGSVNGDRYFTCKPKHGVFAPPSRVMKTEDLNNSAEGYDNVGLSHVERQRRLSGTLEDNSGPLPSIYTTPSRKSKPRLKMSRTQTLNRDTRPRSSEPMSLRRRTHTGNSEQQLQEGTTVFCNKEMGVVRFIGPTHFAEGIWVGVELRTACGKNDGTVQGKRYFSCKPGHGLIVRPSKVTVRGINGAKLIGDSYTNDKSS